MEGKRAFLAGSVIYRWLKSDWKYSVPDWFTGSVLLGKLSTSFSFIYQRIEKEAERLLAEISVACRSSPFSFGIFSVFLSLGAAIFSWLVITESGLQSYLRWVFYGFALFCFFYPVRGIFFVPLLAILYSQLLPGSILRGIEVILLILLVRLVFDSLGRKRFTPTVSDLPLILFFLGNCFSLLALRNTGQTIVFNSVRRLLTLFCFISFYFVLTNYLKSVKELRHYLTSCFTSAGIIILFLVVVWLRQPVIYGSEAEASQLLWGKFLWYRGTIGHYFALLIPLILYFCGAAKSWWPRIGWGILIVLVGLVVLLSFARAVWFGLGIGLLSFFWLVNKKLLVVLLVLFCLLSIFLPAGVREYAHTIFEPEFTDNIPRLTGYRYTLAMIADHPWLGVGFGPDSFQQAFVHYLHWSDIDQVWRNAHNIFLRIAATAGLPTLGVFIFLLLLFFKQWNSIYGNCSSNELRLLLAGILSVMIISIATGSFQGFLMTDSTNWPSNLLFFSILGALPIITKGNDLRYD